MAKKIPVSTLSLPKKIIEHYRDENIEGAYAERSGIGSALNNLLASLQKRDVPLSKNFQVVVWKGYEYEGFVSFGCTQSELQEKLSDWIKRTNQVEVDSIATVTNRHLRYKVMMNKLFPNIVTASTPKNKRWGRKEP